MSKLDKLAIEKQRNTQWCWAAVTSSVCTFLGDADQSQEKIVCRTIGDDDCSGAPTPEECNIPFPLENALNVVKHLGRMDAVLTFEQLRHEIEDNKRPVAICISFDGGTDHFCLIKGCSMLGTVPQVIVLDPSASSADEVHISYDDLCNGTGMGGPWVESFTIA